MGDCRRDWKVKCSGDDDWDMWMKVPTAKSGVHGVAIIPFHPIFANTPNTLSLLCILSTTHNSPRVPSHFSPSPSLALTRCYVTLISCRGTKTQPPWTWFLARSENEVVPPRPPPPPLCFTTTASRGLFWWGSGVDPVRPCPPGSSWAPDLLSAHSPPPPSTRRHRPPPSLVWLRCRPGSSPPPSGRWTKFLRPAWGPRRKSEPEKRSLGQCVLVLCLPICPIHHTVPCPRYLLSNSRFFFLSLTN